MMYFVYSIQSINNHEVFYIGITTNIDRRLDEHNRTHSHHTHKHSPWKLVTYTAFYEHSKALAFEKYLKSGSGRAFAKKHF